MNGSYLDLKFSCVYGLFVGKVKIWSDTLQKILKTIKLWRDARIKGISYNPGDNIVVSPAPRASMLMYT